MLAFPWLAVTFVKDDAGMVSPVFCSQSIIFCSNRSIFWKGHSALMESSGYFGCAVPHRDMDIF